MSEEEKVNKEIMDNCIRMAKMGVDIEKLYKDIKPIVEAMQPIIDLAVKNYNFIQEINKQQSSYIGGKNENRFNNT